MSAEPRQLPLRLEPRPALGREAFLVSPGNAATVARVLDWPGWPGRRLALAGPARAGKTHLAHVWMHASGARIVEAATLDDQASESLAAHGMAVVEDVDRLPEGPAGMRAERALLHLHNLLAAQGGVLMVTGRTAPARWPVQLPDLASRLQAMPLARIPAPDDALLASVMVKLFADRQLSASPEAVHYLVRRMGRSIAEAERIVAALDRLSLATRRPVTRSMAASFLAAETGRPDAEDGG